MWLSGGPGADASVPLCWLPADTAQCPLKCSEREAELGDAGYELFAETSGLVAGILWF